MDIKGQLFTLRLGETDGRLLEQLVRDAAGAGLNAVVLEMGDAFAYRSHPEVAVPWAFPPEYFRRLAEEAALLGVEIIPAVALFSHSRFLMAPHPEFRESPASIYCPSSGVQEFSLDLLLELIDALHPKRVHIAHDECISAYDPRERQSIFACPKCSRRKPWELFAEDVNFYHEFLSRQGIETMMWADSLLDPELFSGHSFALSGCYGGAPDHLERAVSLLPKDILMCDWHYEPAADYPTLPWLMEQGFTCLGSPLFEGNSFLFTSYAQGLGRKNLAGMLGTSWMRLNEDTYPALLRMTRWNGLVFNNLEAARKERPDLALAETCAKEARADIRPGAFRKEYTYAVDGAGIHHSMGWRDLRCMEYPLADVEGVKGSPETGGMCIKAGRAGSISYALAAAPGYRFARAGIELEAEDPGTSALEVSLDGGPYEEVASPVPARGSFDLLFGRYARRMVLRFSAENREGGTKPFIKGFAVEGIVE